MKKRGAAIGNFDGVHRGHKMVLGALYDASSKLGLEPVAITFDRHPLAVVDPERTPPFLSDTEEKESLISETGVNPIVLGFDENIRNTSAADWMRKLKQEYDVQLLVIGYDNRFGCDGFKLSPDDYKKIAGEIGISILETPELPGVSSSKIRKCIMNGNVKEASEKLGRFYSVAGKVTDGNAIGRKFGYPTANIIPEEGKAIPAEGVYAARVKLPDSSEKPAMVNIGTHPTVGESNQKIIETHIIGWEGDLYGKEITISFADRIRDEIKFSNPQLLIDQLEKDKTTVIEILNNIDKEAIKEK